MAKMTYSDFALEDKLRNLESNFRREVTRDCLWAGAKVIEKEMRGEIEKKHSRSGDMARSVAQTPIQEGVDESSVEVYTQGYDSRGVSNPMKNVIITQGYYHVTNGTKRKKDPYLKNLRKRIAPRIQAVMTYQFQLTLKKLKIIE